jgi:hypothetical protein
MDSADPLKRTENVEVLSFNNYFGGGVYTLILKWMLG